MKAYLDHIFWIIGCKNAKLDTELEQIDDEYNTALHYANRGAIIGKERWDEIENKRVKVEEEKSMWECLHNELKKEHHTGNIEKQPQYYIDIIREKIILLFAEKDKFEECLTIQKFANQLQSDLSIDRKQTSKPFVAQRKWH